MSTSVELENWSTTDRTILDGVDADTANSQQKLASLGGVVMTSGDVISMKTVESSCRGGARPHTERGQCTCCT